MSAAFLPAARRGRLARRFLRSPGALIGALIIALVGIAALFAHDLAPASYTRNNLLYSWAQPGPRYPLGADALGRDVLSRLLVAARVSMAIALSVLAITFATGITLGVLAGWFGGRIDNVISRLADLTLAFPEIIIAIIVAAILGSGVSAVIIALSLVGWTGVARISRALVLSLKNEPFIEAAHAAGTRTWRILVFHLLPHMVPALVVRATAGIGFIIMEEATLSFLGLGVQEPLPTWGGMIRDGLIVLRTEPHLALWASLALGLTIIGFNLFGDGLRDILNPRRS